MTASHCVLVVENDQKTLQSLQSILEAQGYQPVLLPSHAAVVEYLSHPASLPCLAALVNYELPDTEDGVTLGLLLEAQIPCIVLTAHNDGIARKCLLELPVVDYVPKENPAAFEYAVKMLKRVKNNPFIKVLIVDDSPVTREYLHTHLRKQCYQVSEAANARQAVAHLRLDPEIRLILVDMIMPEIDGIQFTSWVRSHFSQSQLAIIGISGAEDANLTARFLKAGADDFVKKPLNFEELSCRITRAVEYVENLQALSDTANRDPLTGLFNRRYFFEQAQFQRNGYAVAVLDIDNFKSINDQFGHNIGDKAICTLTQMLSKAVSDGLCARFGGEEFVCLHPDASGKTLLHRLRVLMMQLNATVVPTEDGPMRFSVSIGLATAQPPSDINRAIKQADQLLYQAKNSGRNRICTDNLD